MNRGRGNKGYLTCSEVVLRQWTRNGLLRGSFYDDDRLQYPCVSPDEMQIKSISVLGARKRLMIG